MYNKTSSLIIRTDIIKAMHITIVLTDVFSYLQNADTKQDKQLPFKVRVVKRLFPDFSVSRRYGKTNF